MGDRIYEIHATEDLSTQGSNEANAISGIFGREISENFASKYVLRD